MLTKKDLTLRYGVSKRTIERWMKNGKIPFIRSELNGRIYFDEKEIKEWEQKYHVGKKD